MRVKPMKKLATEKKTGDKSSNNRFSKSAELLKKAQPGIVEMVNLCAFVAGPQAQYNQYMTVIRSHYISSSSSST